MTIWLTSDTHFGHAGIIQWVQRPFASVEEMDHALVQAWNAVVRPRDVVWHLGDFCSGGPGTAARYFARLNGRKHLVRGNHDGDDARSCAWESVQDLASQRVDGVRLVLSHYPMLSWQGSSHNRDGHVASIMCHGHVHGTPRDSRLPHADPCRADVGVDMRSMAPIAAEALVEEVRILAALEAEDAARKANGGGG
ncbi:metallophosphoesterase [Lichenibacterium dinghuense]|uniref:metallophosphoesterase n=1 Tax=Lichenibacterium dinghuense TaxID=2895977 RepID=UPI001F16E8D8|nr:metallophosphoesterase [Lichenibacterium sp. 6Y81]